MKIIECSHCVETDYRIATVTQKLDAAEIAAADWQRRAVSAEMEHKHLRGVLDHERELHAETAKQLRYEKASNELFKKDCDEARARCESLKDAIKQTVARADDYGDSYITQPAREVMAWLCIRQLSYAPAAERDEGVKGLVDALEQIIEHDAVVESYDPIHGEKLGDGAFAEIARQALSAWKAAQGGGV